MPGDPLIEAFYPMPIGIDDACDACGKKGVRGATWGFQKPVICEDCLRRALACLSLPRGNG